MARVYQQRKLYGGGSQQQARDASLREAKFRAAQRR